MIPSERISIIGMACKFPGAPDVESFARLLRRGTVSITNGSPERKAMLGLDAQFQAGWIDDILEFDATFFGIPSKEAHCIDPQQRLFLELSWRAMESAGLRDGDLRNSNTGVFVGASSNDYSRRIASAPHLIDRYFGTGNALSVIANRVSYFFNLRGPSIATDTACSSSLVAVHLACRSLCSRECDYAFAGGVNAILSPDLVSAFSQARMLSPDGRCYVFDRRANGYVRGEGCGVVLMMRTADAIRQGFPILAEIRGTAVNQDGRTNGLTAPNGLAQEAVVRSALQNAGVSAAEIGYIEAHGTGTPLGDPIEIRALQNVFSGVPRDQCAPLWVGSVKASIGHLEAAAGMAGLIKAVIQSGSDEIFPTANFETLNPLISLEGSRIAIANKASRWPPTGSATLIGISGFGFGGTNAHVILSGGCPPKPPAAERQHSRVLKVTAKSAAALRQAARSYGRLLDGRPESELGEVCAAANSRRSDFGFRRAVVYSSASDLLNKLQIVADASGGEGPIHCRSDAAGGLAFVFTGQGSQYAGMGRQLYVSEPTYRRMFDACCEIVASTTDLDLMTAIDDGFVREGVVRTDLAQPAIAALQVCLVELLREWKIVPVAVLGHSVGEIAAAYCAGVISLEGALRLAVARGGLIQNRTRSGAMTAISSSESAFFHIMGTFKDNEIDLAAVNGPSSIVASGALAAIEKLEDELSRRKISFKRLPVSHGFHSSLMDPIVHELSAQVEKIDLAQPLLSYVSGCTGRLTRDDVARPAYWGKQVREAVRFYQGVNELVQQGCKIFLEVGPQPQLTSIAKSLANGIGAGFVPTLKNGVSEQEAMAQCVGSLYERGIDVDWRTYHTATAFPAHKLPGYSFQRQTFSILADVTSGLVRMCDASPEASLTDSNVPVANLRAGGLDRVDTVALTMPQPLFTRVVWREVEAAQSAHASLKTDQRPAAVALFCDAAGKWRGIAEAFRECGISVHEIRGGRQIAYDGDGRWRIRAAEGDDYKELFDRITAQSQCAHHGTILAVVYLWTLDLEAGGAHQIDFAEMQLIACEAPVNIYKSLSPPGKVERARVWFVTGGVAPVYGLPVAVAQSPLWGVAKCAGWELPDLWGGIIDIDPRLSSELGGRLKAVMEGPKECVYALGVDSTHVCRLAPLQGKTAHGQGAGGPFEAGASYLISGGCGALGLAAAEWLSTRGARNIILTYRSRPSDVAFAAIERLRAGGADIVLERANVASTEEVRGIFKRARERSRPIKGAFHLAGVSADGSLRLHTEAQFERTFEGKARGAYVIASLMEGIPNAFLVTFSSMASIIGSPGQASYAAANAFVDTLGVHLSKSGLRAINLNWGPWTDMGLAVRVPGEERAAWDWMGICGLSTEQAISALEAAMSMQEPQLCIANFRWRQVAERAPFPGLVRFLDDVASVDAAVITHEPAGTPDAVHRILAKGTIVEQRAAIYEWIADSIGRITGGETKPAIHGQARLGELGLDSLMLLELRARLVIDAGMELGLETLLSGGTIDQAVDDIHCQLMVSPLSNVLDQGAANTHDRDEIVI